MIRTLSALVLATATTLCGAAERPVQLSDKAPVQHVVVPGDTLWGISAQFLKEPWRWPEIWRMNREQIKDPHWIYPGDVIVLERDENGNPLLRVQKGRSGDGKLRPQVYSEKNMEAIPPIPPNVIDPFISQPLVIEANELDSAARIIATQQDRVFLGEGSVAYVDDADPKQEKWQVYRNGKPLYDPADDTRILGYEAFYLGTATQTRPGQPATFEITSATQEIGRGDRLVPAIKPAMAHYVPHKPDASVDGRVVSIYGGVGSAGRGSIISLSLGNRNGLEIGHVLALERNRIVTERDENDQKINVQIPPERIGLVFIFRTFDYISYALVMQSEGTVEVNDFVRTP
ncbi:MAG: LysM peptidoglycan-binding domain-containing protein [Propionivibrio sp.]